VQLGQRDYYVGLQAACKEVNSTVRFITNGLNSLFVVQDGKRTCWHGLFHSILGSALHMFLAVGLWELFFSCCRLVCCVALQTASCEAEGGGWGEVKKQWEQEQGLQWDFIRNNLTLNYSLTLCAVIILSTRLQEETGACCP